MHEYNIQFYVFTPELTTVHLLWVFAVSPLFSSAVREVSNFIYSGGGFNTLWMGPMPTDEWVKLLYSDSDTEVNCWGYFDLFCR